MTPLPPPFEQPWRLQSFALLASTQDLCRQLAEAGEPGHLAVLAERQSAGRGTQGRGWDSPEGNLFLSVLLRPPARAREVGRWGLLAAVALADTVAALLPDSVSLRLKWPNDLLLDGRKLAGILTESAAGLDGGLDWVVIGFGVNLATAPDLPDRATACLAERLPPPPPESFATDLLARLDTWRARQDADGFAAVRAAWLRYAPEPGSPLTLRLSGQTVDGAFAGLSEDGRLLLESADGVHAFASGEI